jgi:inosine-uridine nucleoside N-ribohydrolase
VGGTYPYLFLEETTMKRVIIDTGLGIDDTAAIFPVLASPELSVEALMTVYGNGAMEACGHSNTLQWVPLNRPQAPVVSTLEFAPVLAKAA